MGQVVRQAAAKSFVKRLAVPRQLVSAAVERSADMDPVQEVLDLDQQLRVAFDDRNMDLIETLHAPEFTLNGPAGKLQSRTETMDLLRTSSGRQVDAERVIEAAYASGDDVVVIMGRESLVWEGTGRPDLDGRRTARRFTNVWHRVGGNWRYIARQATTIPIQ